MTTASSFGPLTLEKILRCWSNETHERSRKHALRRMVETAGLDKRRLGGVGGVVRWGIVSSTVPAVRGLEKMPSDETGGIQIIHLKKKKFHCYGGQALEQVAQRDSWRCSKGIWIWCWVPWVRGGLQ